MAEPTQAALVVKKIGALPVGMFAHRDYLARHGTPAGLADLARHRLIGFDRQSAYVRAMVRRYPMFEGVAFAFRADSTLAQLAAIRAGVGIGMCQAGLAARDPALVRVLPRAFEIALPAWVAMHENLTTSPRCRATYDALVTGLAAYRAR
jgi:DNA-binding transcriptional LysR family regulator